MDRVRINIFSEEQRKKMSFPVVPLWKICFFASSSSPTFSCNMKHLTIEQRYNISAYLQSGKSINQIALLLGVHRSTVWREVHRNEDNVMVHTSRSLPKRSTRTECSPVIIM